MYIGPIQDALRASSMLQSSKVIAMVQVVSILVPFFSQWLFPSQVPQLIQQQDLEPYTTLQVCGSTRGSEGARAIALQRFVPF